MMNTFLDEMTAFVLSLTEREAPVFSSPFHWVCLANGDADFHDNVIFFGFDAQRAEPVLVAKVPRLNENGWMLQAEYDHLVELWHCVGKQAENYVPKPYALTLLQTRPVLMISYVPGESLTRLSRKSFWGNRKHVSMLAREAALALRGLNSLTESALGPDQRPDYDFPKKADAFRDLFPLMPEEERALSILMKQSEETWQAARHKVLIQGDFWHGNMIRNRERGTLMLVDWQFARWSADVSLDVYFFPLAGALFAVGAGPVEQRAKRAFALLMDWRADVLSEYLAAYGKPAHYGLLPQRAGMLMCCVEKAVRPAMEFGYRHPDDILWRSLFAELIHWPIENS